MDFCIDELLRSATVRMCGFDKYKCIIERFKDVDVSKDEAFQRLFTDYYKVRRPTEWRRRYYQAFQEFKNDKTVNFGKIIRKLLEIWKSIDGSRLQTEASFASKMLATICPEMPIWDQCVRNALKLEEIPPYSVKGDASIDKAIEEYGNLVKLTNDHLRKPEVKEELAKFDRIFPAYKGFSAMKKLDVLLWSKGSLGKTAM